MIVVGHLVQSCSCEVSMRPGRRLDVPFIEKLLLDVRYLAGLNWRRYQRIVSCHLVMSWILKL